MSFRFRQIPTHPDYKLACSTEINGSLYRVISVSPTFTNLSATPTLLADPKNPGASSGKLLVNASHIDSYSSSSKKNAGAAAGAGLDTAAVCEEYSKMDGEGFPTHYADGTELTKNQYKKVRKLMEQEKKKAEKKAGKK